MDKNEVRALHKFVLKIILAGLLAVLVAFIMEILLTWTNRSVLSNELKESDFNKVILGDSRVNEGLGEISGFINLSSNSEPYFISYHKLKLMIDNEIYPDTIYLGVGEHRLSPIFREYMEGEKFDYVAHKNWFYLPIPDKIKVLRNNLFSGIKIFQKNFSENFHILMTSDYDRFYGEEPLSVFSGVEKNAVLKRSRLLFKYEPDANLLSCIEKIKMICKKNKIQLYLIEMPVHQDFSENTPPLYSNSYANFLKKTNIPLIRFDIEFNDSDFLPDGDHLSVNGRKKLTKVFSTSF